MSDESFFIKAGYRSRSSLQARGPHGPDMATCPLPDLYPFAGHLAGRFGCRYILDIGCLHALQLAGLHPQFEIIGIGDASTTSSCRQKYPFGEWLQADLDELEGLLVEPAIARQSLVVCANVIEGRISPDPVVHLLRRLLEHSPAAILTTPERDLVRGKDDFGPPADPCRAREWNLAELRAYLAARDLRIQFTGLTKNNDRENRKDVGMVILENQRTASIGAAPAQFKVTAVMAVFNEADVLGPVIEYLRGQGVQVYLIDNWSTDGTFEIATQLMPGLVGLERWPESGPSPIFHFDELLKRKEQLCQDLDADWFIHYDADEIREAPWSGVSLRDAMAWVDRQGYNAIDFNSIDFIPVDNEYPPGSALSEHFRFFEFGDQPAYFFHVKAWKKTDGRVNLSRSGGHSVEFPGRRIYPYKFLMRHYPFRSQRHAERKVFHERRPRYDPALKKVGWHKQYDAFGAGSSFLREPGELLEFDSNFHSEYLVERLARIGIHPHGFESSALEKQAAVPTRLPAVRAGEAKRNPELLATPGSGISAARADASASREPGGPAAPRDQQELVRWVEQREQQVRALQALVDRKDLELSEIYRSRAWRFIQMLRRMRVALIPSGSPLEKFLYRIIK